MCPLRICRCLLLVPSPDHLSLPLLSSAYCGGTSTGNCALKHFPSASVPLTFNHQAARLPAPVEVYQARGLLQAHRGWEGVSVKRGCCVLPSPAPGPLASLQTPGLRAHLPFRMTTRPAPRKCRWSKLKRTFFRSPGRGTQVIIFATKRSN